VAEPDDAMASGNGSEPGPDDSGQGAGDGLRWSFEFDLESVLAEIGRPLSSSAGEDQEAILAAEDEARDNEARDGGAPSEDLAGLIAEHLPAGPGLAAWLAQQDPAQLPDRDLPGTAAAYRKIASWAQAAELATVAQIAVRSAARDEKAGLAADGRPEQVTRDAAAQTGLGLALSPCGAAAWADLAVTLGWRLARTGAALAEGAIDLYRARVIAEATGPLTDEAARQVEDKVLPRAGDLTYGQLHAAVRRAVIAADPEGAEHRRQAAERRARVTLYPDQDHTATLTGTTLPAVHAAAAMARISALARALKASGAAGGIDYLRAHVFLGLLMGTLPLIPPAAGAPPDQDPPPDDDPYGDESAKRAPPHGGPPSGAPAGDRPDDAPPANEGPPGEGRPRGEQPPRHRRPDDAEPTAGAPSHAGDTGPRAGDTRLARDTGPPGGNTEPWPDPPPLTDADAPDDDGFCDSPPLPDGYDDDVRFWGDPLDDHFADRGTVPALPVIPTVVPAVPGNAASADATGRPPAGLLDLSLPWATLTCESPAPGAIGRLGPITATQARQLARLAATDYATQWRVILTDDHDHAIAVGRVPRSHPPSELEQPGSVGLVGRVTITMPVATLGGDLPSDIKTGEILHEILRAAARAWTRAVQLAEADLKASHGCAHAEASAAYRPPPRVREFVAARDLTCRYPYCGQPAWRGDLDHTRAWHRGGRTCRCNLGPLCRAHHILKQLLGWQLSQPRPGIFQWTTPAGCTYTVGPDTHHN